MTKVSRIVQGQQGRVISIDVVHQRIHEGLFFSSLNDDLALASAANMDTLIKPGAGTHLRFIGKASGPCLVELYEGTQVSADGNAIASVNRNRFAAANPSPVEVFDAPTITDVGTLLIADRIGQIQGEETAIGGSAGSFEEWILRSDTNYLIRMNNTDTGAIVVTMELDYYDGATTVR